VPVASDPSEYTRYRHILHPFFSVRGTARCLPTVRALAAELIDGFIDRGECDLVADFAVPLPTQVFLTLFGLPHADRDRLIAWKEALLKAVGVSGAEPPPASAIALAAELYEYLVGHIAARREQAGEDVLSRLLADASERRLTDDEILGLSFLFVLAGLDTVTSALSTAFATLVGRPELRIQIVENYSVMPDAVEELLRFDGPVVSTSWRPARARRRTGQRPWSASITCASSSLGHPRPPARRKRVQRSEQPMRVVACLSSGSGQAAGRPGSDCRPASRWAALWRQRPGPHVGGRSGRSWLRSTWFPSRPWSRYGCSPRA